MFTSLKFASLLLISVFLLINSVAKVEAATLNYQSTSVFGTSALDYGTALKTDSDGNLYTAGQFNAGTVDFDPTSGVDNKTNTLGGYDIFLTKINADGTYGWTKTWGGTGNDAAYNLAIDSNNNVYITGEFLATVDFDPGAGDTSYTSAGSVDIFTSKFDTNGNFLSVKVMGGTSHDRAHGVVINGTGEIFIAGKFTGTVDFDPSGGTDSKVSAGGYDAFLTKFNADETYGWTKTWGSTDRDTVNDLQLGTDGSIYLAGVYRLTVDFDPSGSVDNQTSVGLDDAFLSKFSSDGTYVWTKSWGSTSNDFSFNLRVNSSNDVYIIGSFQGTVDFDPTGVTNSIVSAGLEDSYVSKFDANGNYVFTRVWGGVLMDEVLGITIDTGGNYFIGGFFNGTQDLDPTSGTDSYVSTGAYDMFVSMFDVNDNYITSKTFGSSTETNWWDDQLYELHAYHGTLNIVGNYVGTADFDPTSGTDTKIAVGSGDYFRSTYTTGYTINFDAQSGTVNPTSKEVTYYSTVGSLPTPTRDGYSFLNWNTAANGSGTTYTSSSNYLLSTNLTVYAIYGPSSSTSSSSSQVSSSTDTPSCTDEMPASAPELFQASTTINSAKIFFTPIKSTSQYFISYSANKNAEEHGLLVSLAKEGVQNLNINLLKPNTTYYFKVRGQNGCMTGKWSNTLMVKTNSSIYYKNSAPLVAKKSVNKISSVDNKITSTPTPTISITEPVIKTTTQSPIPIQSPIPTQSKFCLWRFCW